MTVGKRLDEIQIEGYKSIQSCELALGSLNLLIGPNGAGKSNFIAAFGLLGAIVDDRLQFTVAKAGGAASILHGGPKVTSSIRLRARFGPNEYQANLRPSQGDGLIFETELTRFRKDYGPGWHDESLGSGHSESNLTEAATNQHVARYCLQSMSSWKVFHFHDTSSTAGAKLKQKIDDNVTLRSDASNIAPFLYRVRETDPKSYQRIVDAVRQIAPFFDGFILQPDRLNPDRIQLEWRQKGSEQYFNGHSLSDGTLRFICLATLLLQPEPPSTIIIDEPELGLHPAAIVHLAALLKSAAVSGQVIASTQSVTLLNQFEPSDTIVVEHKDGASTFTRPDVDALEQWLTEYAIGELWEKNLLGGRPT